MAGGASEFDLKQVVLYGNGPFGPQEIERLREDISRDPQKYEELRRVVTELRAKDEDELSPAIYTKLGVCQFLIGQYDEAASSLKKGDGGALACFYSAKLHAVAKRWDEAIKMYNTAQRAGYNLDRLDVCVLGRAEVYREMGELEKSLQELDQLSGSIEQTAEYLYQRGATVNAIGGNSQEAIALFERALAEDKNHPGALFGLAQETERRGNDVEALELYKRAALHFPTSVGILINLGILFEDMEEYEQAQACYQRVLDAYPTNPRALLFIKDVRASSEMRYDEEEQAQKRELSVKLNQPISDFELSQRSSKCLMKMEIRTLGDLCRLTEQDLLARENFGETSLREIRTLLQERGLKLGMFSAEKQQAETSAVQLTPEEQSIRMLPVSELNLSVRARKCLNRNDVQTLGDLVSYTADRLLEQKNFGQTSLKEIREKLAGFGLKLKGD